MLFLFKEINGCPIQPLFVTLSDFDEERDKSTFSIV